MKALLATTWDPAPTLATSQTCGLLVSMAVLIAVQPWMRTKAKRAADWMVIVGIPFVLWLAYFFWGANFFLKDGRQYGFPIYIRSFPSADDFLATYMLLGTAYLLARRLVGSSHSMIRWLAWFEAAFIGVLLGIEAILLALRLSD